MLRQHRDLKTQMNRIHDPITSRMPPEVVSTIFQFCLPLLPSGPYGLLRLTKKEVSSPLNLGAVCRTWREIAWSTPHLWCFISVCINAPGSPARCDLASQWLVRSGGLPLTIHIYTSIFYDDNKFLTWKDPFIKLVNQYSSRWHKLDLSVSPSLVSQFCGNSKSHSIMRTLRINPQRTHTTDSVEARFSMQNAKPSPVNVFLSTLRFKAVDLEWNNVTNAEIGDLQIDECIELVKRASKLRRCKLSTFSMSRPGQEHFPIPAGIVTHHKLRVLAWEDPMDSDAVSFFCDKISFPALKDLTGIMDKTRLPTKSLISFIKRSSCVLKNLLIMDAKSGGHEIIELLSATPSLLRLDLLPPQSADYSPGPLFQLLTKTSISRNSEESLDPFLPKLRFFRYHVQQNFSWDHVPEIFGPLSELDNPCRRPLHSVWIHFDRYEEDEDPLRYIDKDTVLRLLPVLESRLDLDIGYPAEQLDLIEASMKYHGMVDDNEDCLPPGSPSSSGS